MFPSAGRHSLVPPAIVEQEIDQERSVRRCEAVRNIMMKAYGRAFKIPIPKEERHRLYRDLLRREMEAESAD